MQKRRLTGRRLQRVRDIVRHEQPLCPECERHGVLRGWDELDHIVPLFKGGTDDRDNLVGLCAVHHAAKTALDLRRRPAGACDAAGHPVDPGHPWAAEGVTRRGTR